VVRGLNKFREQFSAHAGQYGLIGGAACDFLMEEAGLGFRATKVLDIVISVETLDASFVRAFWEFVRTGNTMYNKAQQERGATIAFRSLKTTNTLSCWNCLSENRICLTWQKVLI
jgi:hypothetical protein